MARIYVTSPDALGGVAAMGQRILGAALERAGHDVTRVAFERTQIQTERRGVSHAAETVPPPDAWFVSAIYTRQWWALPGLLRRIGVATRTEERRPSDPLIAIGGQSMIAPAPILDFADVIALGDGEATGPRIAELLDAGLARPDVMAALRAERGFWTPESETLTRLEMAELLHPIVPASGRGAPVVEVARGCASKCAFCPIGWAGGTYRESDRTAVTSNLLRLRGKQVNVFAPDYSSISWVEDLDETIERSGCKNASRDARLDATIKYGSQKSYSFGIEGMSERLRAAIGKPMANARIVEAVKDLASKGVRELRLYVIFALPGETDDDMRELLDVLDAVRPHLGKTRLDVTQTHLQCVPHTPFERLPNDYDLAGVARALHVRDHLRALHDKDGVIVMASQPKGRALHETDAWLQRAGRGASRILEDMPSVFLSDERWRAVAFRHDVNVDAELRGEHLRDGTPWDFVESSPPRMRERVLATYRRHMGDSGHGTEEAGQGPPAHPD